MKTINTRPRTGAKKPRLKLAFESLESRQLLAGIAELIQDVNLYSGSAANLVYESTWLNGELIFAADDGQGDVELWKSDGTRDGTRRILDIQPGRASSFPRQLTVVAEQLFFTAYRDNTGRELWVTDGSEQGTRLVMDAVAGPGEARYMQLSPADGVLELYLEINWGTELEQEWWITDGTPVGTFQLDAPLEDPFTGVTVVEGQVSYIDASGSTRDLGLAAEFVETLSIQANRTYFTLGSHSVDRQVRRDLWVTDGTSAGTYRLAAGDEFGLFLESNDRTYFVSNRRQAYPRFLWSTDGTPEGTELLWQSVDLDSTLSQARHVDSRSYFLLGRDTNVALMQTDGTSAGTRSVALPRGYRDGEFMVAGKSVYLILHSAATTFNELWKIDPGTLQLTHIDRLDGVDIDTYPPRVVFEVGASAYLRTTSGLLWRLHDDTIEQVSLDEYSFISQLNDVTYDAASGRTLIWTGTSNGHQLWSYDVPSNDIELLNSSLLRPTFGATDRNEPGYARVGDLFVLKGRLLALLSTEESVHQLWILDDTLADSKLSPLAPLVMAWQDRPIIAGNRLYFTSSKSLDDVAGELWVTDGTLAGTSPVILPSGAALSSPSNLQASGTDLIFLADAAETSRGIWKTDGTAAGTVLLATPQDLDEWWTSRGYEQLFVVGDAAYYITHTGQAGEIYHLWRIDSDDSAPKMIAQLPSKPVSIHTADEGAYLVFRDTLWFTDGTADGTIRIPLPPTEQFEVEGIVGSKVLIRGTDAVGRLVGLFAADRHSITLIQATEIRNQPDRFDVTTVGAWGYFWVKAYSDAANPDDTRSCSTELWKTDGTLASTTRVAVSSGLGVCYFGGSLQIASDNLFFLKDGDLWQTDGTESGTIPIADGASFHEWQFGSMPNVALFGEYVYFVADDGYHGAELHRVSLAAEIIPGDANHDGVFNSSDLVQVFQRGEYEDGIANNSTFEDGDWNGDGEFDTSDLVAAFQAGNYIAAAERGTLAPDAIDMVLGKSRRVRAFVG